MSVAAGLAATPAPEPSPAAGAPLTGYHLPWRAGDTAIVTQIDNASTDHVDQVDFILDDGDVYAAKPGTVVYVKQSSNAGCQYPPRLSECWRKANAIVIKHGPNEYSWYVHIAYRSATVSVGQDVGYGTPIARQGSTGYTCNADCSGPGPHLHFMVSRAHDVGSHCDAFGCWPDPNDPDDVAWGVDMVPVDFAEAGWIDLAPGQRYRSTNAVANAAPIPSPNASGAAMTNPVDPLGSSVDAENRSR
ncbi:MAG TPA: M23 family metallopeptidase [Chloroflexota bacterium]|nr:M23 family metallopeptidase [Chloroflexota bacterium]